MLRKFLNFYKYPIISTYMERYVEILSGSCVTIPNFIFILLLLEKQDGNTSDFVAQTPQACEKSVLMFYYNRGFWFSQYEMRDFFIKLGRMQSALLIATTYFL